MGARKPTKCKGCPAYSQGKMALPIGPEDAQMVFVLEKPLQDHSETMFEMTLQAIGVPKGLVRLDALCRCVKAGGEAIDFCMMTHLIPSLKEAQHNMVVCMGEKPMQALMGRSGLDNERGWVR